MDVADSPSFKGQLVGAVISPAGMSWARVLQKVRSRLKRFLDRPEKREAQLDRWRKNLWVLDSCSGLCRGRGSPAGDGEQSTSGCAELVQVGQRYLRGGTLMVEDNVGVVAISTGARGGRVSGPLNCPQTSVHNEGTWRRHVMLS